MTISSGECGCMPQVSKSRIEFETAECDYWKNILLINAYVLEVNGLPSEFKEFIQMDRDSVR